MMDHGPFPEGEWLRFVLDQKNEVVTTHIIAPVG